MKHLILSLALIVSLTVVAQKKVLDHSDYDIWNVIKNQTISTDGNFIIYALEKGRKDSYLKIKNSKGNSVFEHERAEKGKFTYDSKFAIFTIKAWKDSLTEMKRNKVKKDKLPKDTLGIYNLKSNSLTKIPNVKSYKSPEKWSGYIAYLLEEVKKEKKKSEKKVEESDKKEKKKKTKKVGKDNGYHLVLRGLESEKQDTLKFVTNYVFSEKGNQLSFITTGTDNVKAGVYVYDLNTYKLSQIYEAKKSKYYQLKFSITGNKLGFIVDNDSTKTYVRPNELYIWKKGDLKAEKLVDGNSAPKGYRVSSDGIIHFSKNETKLYFGLAKPAIVQDTTLLDDEIVNVEVWSYKEPRLYTLQESQLSRDKKKSFTTVINLNNNNKLVQIATDAYPNASLGSEGNSEVALVSTSLPYQLASQWKGSAANDYALVNTNTGKTERIITGMTGRLSLSPASKYVFGYNSVDSTWVTYNITTKKLTDLTLNKPFYDEINDRPMHPRSYGITGWSEDDASIFINDRYDIWEFKPNSKNGRRITDGRTNKTSYRYIRLDAEERFVDADGKWLLATFSESSKFGGYYSLNNKNKKRYQLVEGPYSFSRPQKAVNNDRVIYTKQSFEEYPDIRYNDLNFKSEKQISNANPQQKDYNWGTSEIVNWTSLDGDELEGMLFKPENFDPNKKYPMIVYFYEKSSNGIHRYKTPSAGRASINYSFYTSRGYLVFNPNINYRIGYPGESAYNCIIPGITSLIEQGFVDKENIGVQGHSWGGYQIAYLVTRTNIFKAAESGAPVSNMISAYGGIRWASGMSRQFQYEHTQSRIGGTPWEYPARFVENSPIFFVDKINTPLLILHNDEDGAVPWYQGIEFFTALRRLGKPSWLLNYNGEAHGIRKHKNQKDFTIRMAQFFDHYLKAAPKPVWMDRGLPVIEKGINQGLELLLEKK